MSICGNCGVESTRIKTHFCEDGSQYDECPQCNHSAFEKMTDPSDKKIWMGYEAHPNEYEKQYDKDGLIFMRKPEYRAEQEQRLMQQTEEERERQARAIAKKRATRRTEPMTESETLAAVRKASEIASWLVLSASEGRDVN